MSGESQQGQGQAGGAPWYRRNAVLVSLAAIGLLRLGRRTRARVERRRERVAIKELRRRQRQDARRVTARRRAENQRQARRRQRRGRRR